MLDVGRGAAPQAQGADGALPITTLLAGTDPTTTGAGESESCVRCTMCTSPAFERRSVIHSALTDKMTGVVSTRMIE